MKIFIDTADVEAIRRAKAMGFVSGVTTNPSLIAAEGKDLRLALDTAYSTAAAELRAHLNYLSMIVTLSPLLGLLGTIAGMISSFQIFNLQAGRPMAITGGIGEALIATAAGLCVAIFALIVHTVFAQKMDDILTAIEKADAIISSEGRRRGI